MDDFVLLSVLSFDDDTISVQPLHRGSKQSCIEAADLIDALSYSGPKRVVESCVEWMPWPAFEAAIDGRPAHSGGEE